MSAVWSLSGGKRTFRLRSPTSEFAPDRTFGIRYNAALVLKRFDIAALFLSSLSLLRSDLNGDII